jgi:galactose mutarotase-like enzyme
MSYLWNMVRLHNESMEVSVNPLGAEMQKLKNLITGVDHLWSGDPAYWGKFSPVLFPVVGTLKNDHYTHNGTVYTMSRHGFAREKLFLSKQISETEAIFTLEDDESTRVIYPFRFVLRIRYLMEGSRLTVTYTVCNTGDGPMYFSIGAHPAFAIPWVAGLAYEDHQLVFSEAETAGRWGLKDGLLLDEERPLLRDRKVLSLSGALFAEDAIVLKGLRSKVLTLRSDRDPHGFHFGIEGWPHLGIWAAPGAPFVCIEPWQGHADPVSHDGEFSSKPGIVELQPGEDWENSWWVSLF